MPTGIAPALAPPDRLTRRARLNALRWQRTYLSATCERLRERICFNEAKIAQIDAELAALGSPRRNGPPRPRKRSPHFAHGELPRRVLAVLRSSPQPLHIREIVEVILTANGLDPDDRALADWTTKHARSALGGFRDRGLVRLIGERGNRESKWVLD